VKKYVKPLSDDPHPYVVGETVKRAPGLLSDERLKEIESSHPDPDVRAQASQNYFERHIFGNEFSR